MTTLFNLLKEGFRIMRALPKLYVLGGKILTLDEILKKENAVDAKILEFKPKDKVESEETYQLSMDAEQYFKAAEQFNRMNKERQEADRRERNKQTTRDYKLKGKK